MATAAAPDDARADPAALAAWLVGAQRASVGARPHARGDDDGDDDGEDVDEENAADAPADEPTVEEDLAAVAKALELAKAAVEQLQLKMVLKASEQMDAQEHRADDASKRHSSEELERATRPGVPLVGARAITSATSCAKCSRYFSAFQRGRNCASCGHLFCPKCISRQQILPNKFGHADRVVRVCDPCTEWFQRALDRYFDAVDLVRLGTKERDEKHRRDHELLALRVRKKSRGSDPPVLSPKSLHHQRRMEYRSQRHSIAVPDRKPKPWFSGNLRAMHVNDRLPRRRSTTEMDVNGEDGEDGKPEAELLEHDDVDTGGHSPSVNELSVVSGHSHRERASTIGALSHPPSISIDTSRHGSRRRSLESSDGEEANEEDESIPSSTPIAEPRHAHASIPEAVIHVSVGRSRSLSKPMPKVKLKRKTKYSRSASIDFANLATLSGQPPVSPAASDANESVRSGAGSVSNIDLRASFSSSKKCFDDSDIVDGRRSFVGNSDAGTGDEDTGDVHAAEDLANLPATVLRFPVYDVGSKDGQSLKRSLVRFGKKNIVLDRYTLEVDRALAIVRVKSVFMHRYWAFRCDAIHSVTPFGSGGNGAGIAGDGASARVLVMKQGGSGYQQLEWEFGSEKDRDEFADVVEELKSRVVTPIAQGSNNQNGESELQTPRANGRLDDNNESQEIFPQLMSSGLEVNDKPIGSTFPLLPGEEKVTRTDLPVIMLIGASGDGSASAGETTSVWSRMRGFITVTNFRVIFVHLPEQCQSMHPTIAVAYIPLFAIISAQVIYSGGRRPRSTRAYQSTAPPVVVISCKDARLMHLELEGSPHVADERSQSLQAVINRMAEASQRYRTVKSAEPALPSGMSLENFEIGDHNVPLSDFMRESMPPVVQVAGPSASSSPRSLATDESALSHALLPSSASSVGSPAVHPQPSGSTERSDVFAFFYSVSTIRNISDDVDGWKLYSDEREFRRQIVADPVAQPFLKLYQNTRGNVCKSYPAKLLVPASMTSSTLMKVAEFRAKNRLPVITYYHQQNRCVLVRCGQPLLGNLLSGSSSLSDQLLLGIYRRFPEIIRTQSSSAPSSRPIYIFDARKLKASTGNRLMGKGGVETPQDYPGAVVYHLNIANMYRMQSSYQQLLKLVLPGGVDDQDKAWLASLEATRWLSHVRQVLEGAVKIARVLELEGSSALVHCSDGWDRTAQLTSLAQIMIDPFYRTIRGFAVVVEKDWCAFGHKFSERLGGDRGKDPQRNKSSPVFFQFLDAVWQILRQFPTAFEFDERFLLHIANALTSGLYGTFLYDSRLDRDTNDVKSCTVSVWTPVLMTPEAFSNPDYKLFDAPIWPWTSTQMIRLWESYFFQWHSKYYGCRWTASLVRHHHSTTEEQKGVSLQRSLPPEESPFTESAVSSLQTPSSLTSTSSFRERQGSGETTGNANRSLRHPKEERKSPPMHKIFLFKN